MGKGELGPCGRCGGERRLARRGAELQELGKALLDRCIVVGRKGNCGSGRQDPEQVLSTGRSAEGTQQPRSLEVLQKRGFVKLNLMLRSELDKLRLDVLSRA